MRVHSLPRRDFLKAGSLAFGGLALADILAADTAKKEISCIVIFQNGGASQLDTFDPKPDAPAEIRGSSTSIPTNVPGIHISGQLPQTARMISEFSIIRSMHSDEAIHERARQYIYLTRVRLLGRHIRERTNLKAPPTSNRRGFFTFSLAATVFMRRPPWFGRRRRPHCADQGRCRGGDRRRRTPRSARPDSRRGRGSAGRRRRRLDVSLRME